MRHAAGMKGFLEYMTIQDNLSGKTVSELKEIAGQIGCTGYSRLKKAELVGLVAENLADSETMKIFLTTIDEDEFKGFKKIRRSPDYKGSSLPSFVRIGFGAEKKGSPFCLVQEILDFSLDELDKTFYQNRRYMQKLNRYLTAFVNFYGIIDLDEAVELLQKYEGLTLTRNDLFVDASTLCMACGAFWVDSERVMAASLKDQQDMLELWNGQQGKPYAVLPKNQILRYAEGDYSPSLPQAEPVKRILREYFHLSQQKARDITDAVCLAARKEQQPGDVFNCLKENGLTFAALSDVQYFLQVYTALYNHMPLWINRGFSPAAMTSIVR